MLCDKGFHHFDDLFLLAARKPRDRFKRAARAAARRGAAPGLGNAEKFLDGNTEGLSHRRKYVRARRVAAGLPITDIGMILANLPGEFAHGKPRRFAQRLES